MEKAVTQELDKKQKRMWVLRHPFKTLFLTLGVLALMCFGLIIWADYDLFGPDPCIGWKPGMTGEEKILLALKSANNSRSMVFEIVDPKTGVILLNLGRQVPYENYESILREQPDCCHIYAQHTVYMAENALTLNPRAVLPEKEEALPEGDEGNVVMRYMAQFRKTDGSIYAARTYTYLDLNSCKR